MPLIVYPGKAATSVLQIPVTCFSIESVKTRLPGNIARYDELNRKNALDPVDYKPYLPYSNEAGNKNKLQLYKNYLEVLQYAYSPYSR